MQKNAKAVRIAVLSTMLAPALCLGLATTAHAGTLKKDGCTLTPLRPVEHLPRTSPKSIDYTVQATCGPKTTVTITQIVWEDDDGIFDGNDRVARLVHSHNFTQTSGRVTKLFTRRVTLPDTEGGAEEMFHEISFRVSSGPLTGNPTGWTSSPNRSFTN